jgi:putative FmdB family regulatory protein
MITYTYKCNRGHQFDKRQSIKSESLIDCECGGRLQRIIQTPHFAFCKVRRQKHVWKKNCSNTSLFFQNSAV